MPQVLDVQQARGEGEKGFKVLIPLHNPDHVTALMKLAVPVVKANGGEIIVLGVIDVPRNLPVHEGMRFVHHKAPLLKTAIQYAQEHGISARPAIRIAHRIYDGILRAAEEERVSLILMGWKGYTTTRDRIMGEVTDKVVRLAPCDLITVKLQGDVSVDRLLIPTAGGPHAGFAAEYVSLLHREYGTAVSCCYVVGEGASPVEKETALEWIDKTIHRTGLEGAVDRRLVEGKKVASALVKAAGDFDMIVLGASKEGVFSSVLFGEIPEKVARYSRTPVMIVKRYEGRVKSVIKKILG
jgi:nucleotide-binding universal stress UspA family protein